ncbi:MAG: isoprenyl transferase [Dialister micraerophilus]|jgi:hypothetical protein|uniref:Isoprenyl transferase n=1 Tax=Dialister micraerophilus UPII 345-E TaxID=910314 RepID=E4L8R8_9FIRM|nr:isoprenyl transferase [Dialister micraerophilus]EFR42758.1 di-trans,poly-cis-decaprenylcistransferase [Dialister micraerophilus UPII 345-E]MDK8253250.1 isoprenyl transferase [Dialister micraerophilus]
MYDKKIMPQHVAIILDGNGRWGKKHGRERTYGHKFGAANVKKIVRFAASLGIKKLTLYAFSTENWKRPKLEVKFLMTLFKEYLIEQLRELTEDNVQVHVVGDVSKLSKSLQEEIKSCENDTKNNDGLILNIAINYGGRQELVHAFRKIASDVKAGILNPSEIDEENIKDALYASDADDVDLLIRTGGEQRISNFLLWQISYSELYFTSVLWPDFDERELENAIKWFVNRNRRFGGLMVNK